MAKFNDAIAGLLKAEGGFAEQDNTAGAVKYGITERFLQQHGIDLDGDHDINRQDVLLVDSEVASNLYWRYFWLPLQLDKVDSQREAVLIFHMGVNQGIYWAAVHAQKALNQLGATLTVDGNIGPKTLAAINFFPTEDFIREYKAEALSRYQWLARRRPQLYADDLIGWTKRLEAL